MKKELLDYLACPACLPRESSLTSGPGEVLGDDIIRGVLRCSSCGKNYPVKEGVAILLADSPVQETPTGAKYENDRVVSSYLWSHYGEFLGDTECTDAYSRWAGQFSGGGEGLALDVGCAVGRFTFQLGYGSRLAVGVDRSEAFIRLARRLAGEGELSFPLTWEGNISTRETIRLPGNRPRGHVEFIVADALALPFARGLFSKTASLNILDKVPDPLQHLREVNRVAKQAGAEFLFSDPFSWSADVAPEAAWLGGKTEGPYAGSGKDNVRRLLLGDGGILVPSWEITSEGSVQWKIRNHRNHYELITSEYIAARR